MSDNIEDNASYIIIKKLMLDGHPVGKIKKALMDKGVTQESIEIIMDLIIEKHGNEIFEAQTQKQKKEGNREGSMIFMSFSLVLIALSASPLLITVGIVTGIIFAYLFDPQKAIATIPAFILAAFLFKFANEWYFANRTAFIKIEMAIPMIMATAPALALKYLLEKMIYSNENE